MQIYIPAGYKNQLVYNQQGARQEQENDDYSGNWKNCQ